MLGVLALVVFLAACDASPPKPNIAGITTGSPEEIEERLHGSWLREHEAQGVKSRRVLTLGPDRSFRETVRVVDTQGAAREFVHEGHWFYDGVNLKRKYTLYDGKPPSRLNLPFVTFQIEFQSRNDFVGIDHIHRNRVQYRRVPLESRP